MTPVCDVAFPSLALPPASFPLFGLFPIGRGGLPLRPRVNFLWIASLIGHDVEHLLFEDFVCLIVQFLSLFSPFREVQEGSVRSFAKNSEF